MQQEQQHCKLFENGKGEKIICNKNSPEKCIKQSSSKYTQRCVRTSNKQRCFKAAKVNNTIS